MATIAFLPSLDLGFASRLEAINIILKDNEVVVGEDVYPIDLLWVVGDEITDRAERGAYRLIQQIEWLEGHIKRGGRKPNRQQRPAPLTINLPPIMEDRRLDSLFERLDALESVIYGNAAERVVEFACGTRLALDRCRVLGDQVVSAWEKGTGHKIEATLTWLEGQIKWETRKADRSSARPAGAKKPRSIHPTGRMPKAKNVKIEAEVKAKAEAAAIQLNPGRASAIGERKLTEKREAKRAELKAELATLEGEGKVEEWCKLSDTVAAQIKAVKLDEAEINRANTQAKVEERAAKLKNPHYGEARAAVKPPKADKQADGKKKGKGKKAA